MMTAGLSYYLENIRCGSKLDHFDEREVINEIKSHIEDKFQELIDSGISEEEAIKTCLKEMGSTKIVARQIYEAYSQGSWKQVLLASTPHLLFGLLFVLNWWHHVGWISVVLSVVLGTAIYGWWHGKPNWVFSWLGYSLLPVLVVGLLLIYLPRGWSLLAIPVYIPLALWWLFRIIIQISKKDWLLSSLMLLPIPIIIGWFLAVFPGARFTEYSVQRVYYFAPWIGLSFIALALTIAAFIRLRKRWLRISLLIFSGLLTLALVVYYANSSLNTPTCLVLILVMWGVFLIPPLLERWIRDDRLKFLSHGDSTNLEQPA